MKQKNLTRLAIALGLLLLVLTSFLVYYTITHQAEIEARLRNQIIDQVERNRPANGANGEEGRSGYTPVKGTDYFDGADGADGKDGRDGDDGRDGINGLNGSDGKDGANGQPGAPGRTLEIPRCVVIDEHTRRLEQKYEDSNTYQVLYYLAPGQLCPQESDTI